VKKADVDRLKAMNSGDRAREKSRLLAAVGKHDFERRGFTVRILQIGRETESGRLRLTLAAEKNGQALDLTEANPFFYENPPVLAPDGTFSEELDDRGNTIKKHNFKADAREALQEILTQSLELIFKD